MGYQWKKWVLECVTYWAFAKDEERVIRDNGIEWLLLENNVCFGEKKKEKIMKDCNDYWSIKKTK